MASLSRAYSNTTMNTCLIFLSKAAQDPRQRDMVANFWAAPTAWFQDRTGPNSEDSLSDPAPVPLSDFLLVLCGRILPDHIRAPDTCWKTTLKALSIEPQFFSAILRGALNSDDAWTLDINLVTFTIWILRKTSSKFGSTTLSGSFHANHGA